MANPDQSRRRFVGTLIVAVAGLFSLGKFLIPAVPRKVTLLKVPRSELPLHGALVYQEARVALVREAQEVYALSLVCTHLGCTVNVTPDGLVCPCHGSRFDRQGRVLEGPAASRLRRLRVEEAGAYYEVVA